MGRKYAVFAPSVMKVLKKVITQSSRRENFCDLLKFVMVLCLVRFVVYDVLV